MEKLKSIYNEAPIIDGTTKSTTSSNEATLVEKQKVPTKSNSRIIPLEVKNTKRILRRGKIPYKRRAP